MLSRPRDSHSINQYIPGRHCFKVTGYCLSTPGWILLILHTQAGTASVYEKWGRATQQNFVNTTSCVEDIGFCSWTKQHWSVFRYSGSHHSGLETQIASSHHVTWSSSPVSVIKMSHTYFICANFEAKVFVHGVAKSS